MSGFQTNLLTGLAADLHSASIGTYAASGVYTITQTGIVFGTMPQGPDRCICLDTYPVSDDSDYGVSIIGVQVRSRWSGADPTKVKDLDDLIFDRWHGRHDFTLTGGVYIEQLLHQSGASLGQDQNLRWMYSHNYYAWLSRPTTYRH